MPRGSYDRRVSPEERALDRIEEDMKILRAGVAKIQQAEREKVEAAEIRKALAGILGGDEKPKRRGRPPKVRTE